ncbi:hypothetical protein RvY_15074 [Ramazzottius varieornatus]|uniref:Uncharacterized protein n=1 Tax=Ramazzottius varieornatus TaxID=947166 RepID=A0A1D1VTK4_RAMVA|nr:hypothetical protein RvY_15074 [Ramazzottius varieornatus]
MVAARMTLSTRIFTLLCGICVLAMGVSAIWQPHPNMGYGVLPFGLSGVGYPAAPYLVPPNAISPYPGWGSWHWPYVPYPGLGINGKR